MAAGAAVDEKDEMYNIPGKILLFLFLLTEL